MAEANQLTWEVDNTFIPKYTPNNLKWYEKDRLETWYRQNKCNEFLSNTDNYFQKMRIVNFDIIKNKVEEDKLKQYQTIDHEEIKHYPPHLQEQICSSIFHNSNQKDMHIQKETIKNILLIKRFVLNVGDFKKKSQTICMHSVGNFFFFFFFFCKFIA